MLSPINLNRLWQIAINSNEPLTLIVGADGYWKLTFNKR